MIGCTGAATVHQDPVGVPEEDRGESRLNLAAFKHDVQGHEIDGHHVCFRIAVPPLSKILAGMPPEGIERLKAKLHGSLVP